LWDTLTVEQHVRLFNKIKSTTCDSEDVRNLLTKCGLKSKLKAQTKTLSGGQKRKVQLMMMLTGGSRVCCVDEVSGGLDPLSRRHVWDILLAERATRTILLTTHFLDEAELLADHIVVLSKGSLKAEGSSVELKNKLGGGYRVEVLHGSNEGPAPKADLEGVAKHETHNETTYVIPDSATGLQLITMLDDEGITNYRVSGPTLQEVFLTLADEVSADSDSDILAYRKDSNIDEVLRVDSHNKEKALVTVDSKEREITLRPGRPVSFIRQATVLCRKRFTIMMRNSFPSMFAVCIPIIAAGVLTILIRNYSTAGCSRAEQVHLQSTLNLSRNLNLSIVVGPRSALSTTDLGTFSSSLSSVMDPGSEPSILDSLHFVDTLDEFNIYIKYNFQNLTPGGIFLGGNGSAPTFAYKADGGVYSEADGGMFTSIFMQNAMDQLLTNISISTQFNIFDVPWAVSRHAFISCCHR
jgi:ATP-binding cassette, subfamily A (ABC1), member 3